MEHKAILLLSSQIPFKILFIFGLKIKEQNGELYMLIALKNVKICLLLLLYVACNCTYLTGTLHCNPYTLPFTFIVYLILHPENLYHLLLYVPCFSQVTNPCPPFTIFIQNLCNMQSHHQIRAESFSRCPSKNYSQIKASFKLTHCRII